MKEILQSKYTYVHCLLKTYLSRTMSKISRFANKLFSHEQKYPDVNLIFNFQTIKPHFAQDNYHDQSTSAP